MFERCLGARTWLAALLLVIGSLLAPTPALADWPSKGCVSCHGAIPAVADTVAEAPGACGTANFTLGLGEGFMNSQTNFIDHVHTRGATCTVSQMSGLSNDADGAGSIYAYLVNIRDGFVGSVSPSFPSTAVGSSSTDAVSFTIRNYRKVGTTYSVSPGGEYSVISHSASGPGCSAGNLPAATDGSGAACTVNLTIRFSPAGPGSRSGSITVTPAATGGLDYKPRTSNFSATGFVPTPSFSRTPGTLILSARLGSSDVDTVTIGNPSGTANLVLNSLSFTGTAGVFTRGGSCFVGISIAPGNTCTVNVTYTPTAIGPQNGTLVIGHNAAGSPSNVTLNATGTQSLISPTSGSIDFGNVQQGVPRLRTQVITNGGSAPLNFLVPLPNSAGARTGAGAADYSVSGCASAVPPGGTCTLNITLTPSALAARPATLTINSDAPNGPAVFTLSGSGVALPDPSVAPNPPADFPDTVIGQAATATRTVTVTNDRTRDVGLTITAPTDFEIAGGSCGSVLIGGGSCTVVLRFRPGVAGGESRRTGNFRFNLSGTSGDPDPDPINVGVAGQALFPLALSATVLTPSAVVGSPTTSTVVLTNRASSAFTLSTITYGGAQGSDYSRDATSTCTAGAVLAAGAACNLVTRFNPPVAGTRTGSITLAHTGSAGSPQVVTLNGTAIPAPQGRIELSATTLTYADTQLASNSAQTLTVHNGGNLALNFSAFTFGGTNAADFSRGGSCAVGTPLPIAADCTVVVSFAPGALGLRTGSLTITSDASNGAAVISLSGTGVPIPAPQVMLTPTLLDFGTQTIGGLYPARRIRLTNSGTADLTVASIVVAGAGFANASATMCPAVLAAGADCNIDIAFGATAATPFTGTLTVTDNAIGSPHVAQLRGEGSASALPVLAYLPATPSLDFGSVSAGSLSATQTVTVQNQGPGGAQLTVLNTVGPDAASFSIVGGTCAVDAPLFEGATCTITIQFAPGSGGVKTADVQIASTGSFPPVLTLTGTGLAGPSPVLALSSAAMAFDTTPVGAQSLPASVRITSSGTGVVTVSAIAVTGAFAIQSSTCPATPFSLPAGTECSVSLNFKPTDSGSATGTLSITSDAAPAVREVALSGTGEKAADTSSGGCTIGDGTSPTDPLLWLMVLFAAAWLARREQQRRAERRALRRIDTSVQSRRELP